MVDEGREGTGKLQLAGRCEGVIAVGPSGGGGVVWTVGWEVEGYQKSKASRFSCFGFLPSVAKRC